MTADRPSRRPCRPTPGVRLPASRPARAKGLEAPYIAGGDDPDPAAGLAEERHYGRLLLGMVDRDRRVGLRHRHRHRPRRAGRWPLTRPRGRCRPAAAVPATTWDAAHDVARRDAARPHPHPVGQPATDPRRPTARPRVARYLADRLTALGLEPEVLEPVPGRGSVHARLRGDGTGGEPFLLLSHLDVVPAPAGSLDPRPVRGGRRRRLRLRPRRGRHEGHDRARARRHRPAGRRGARRRPRPGPDPIPGLRRDVLFTCTADEEAGGDRRRRLDRRRTDRTGCGRPAPSTSAAACR